jgi:hypothetical protein
VTGNNSLKLSGLCFEKETVSKCYEMLVVKTLMATVLHIITKNNFLSIKITVISHVIKAPSFTVIHTQTDSRTCQVSYWVFCICISCPWREGIARGFMEFITSCFFLCLMTWTSVVTTGLMTVITSVFRTFNEPVYHRIQKDSIEKVQTSSGAHPASYPMGTGGPFPGGKARQGRDADHSPPSSAEVKNE